MVSFLELLTFRPYALMKVRVSVPGCHGHRLALQFCTPPCERKARQLLAGIDAKRGFIVPVKFNTKQERASGIQPLTEGSSLGNQHIDPLSLLAITFEAGATSSILSLKRLRLTASSLKGVRDPAPHGGDLSGRQNIDPLSLLAITFEAGANSSMLSLKRLRLTAISLKGVRDPPLALHEICGAKRHGLC